MPNLDERIKVLATRIAAQRDPKFDERDQKILDASIVARDAHEGPRVGDYVRFPSGRMARISYVCRNPGEGDFSYQTSESGSWYLGEEYTSFSGQLDSGVPKLARTDETRDGTFWFFHHGYAQAHSGVSCVAPCRVYTSDIDPRD